MFQFVCWVLQICSNSFCFLVVIGANLQSSTLLVAMMGFLTRQQTTASTLTVTESRDKTCIDNTRWRCANFQFSRSAPFVSHFTFTISRAFKAQLHFKLNLILKFNPANMFHMIISDYFMLYVIIRFVNGTISH